MLRRHLIPLLAALGFVLLTPLQSAHAATPSAVPSAFTLAREDAWLSVPSQRQDPIGTLQSDGWATVERVVGPELVEVRNALGERLRVWHVGVIGPDEVQGEWRMRATQMHAELLQPGTRVWLEIQHGAKDESRGRWVYRHVYRDGAPDEPIGAALLRSGMTWVFPHTSHGFIPSFANDQAMAVAQRAGLWEETQSSAVFQPEGSTYGGFPIDPRVLPVLKALDTDPVGKEVLANVNDFPVEIGVSRLPRGVLGGFAWRFYSIQLSQDIMDAPAESVAAVLVHELTHAKQMIEAGVQEADLGCYDMEVQAFESSAKYWADLYGPNGKRRATHWLDNTLNANLRDYNNKRLAQSVRRAYGHECGAFADGTSTVDDER